ncbi:MAG: ATP-grasp domain-containing protein, partial [Thermodesulfobacteriota bacterium]
MRENKAIFLIGVGEIGINQIHWARNAGFHVITSNTDANAPAMSLADEGVVMSGTDTRSLVSFALESLKHYNVNAVYSGNDFGVFSASVISHALGIPGLSIAAVSRSLGKQLMKECWRDNDVPTPPFKLIKTEADAQEAINEFGLPVIIKPADSSGSQGIQLVREVHELVSVLTEAALYTKHNAILLEKYIEGRHIDANAFFWENKFYGCGVSERFFSPLPYRVPIGGYEPATISQDEEATLYQLFEKATRCLGIDHGPVKADFILSNKGFHAIEISARFHGDVGTSHSTFHRTDLSPLIIYFETLFAEQVPLLKLNDMLSCKRFCGWRVFDLPEGYVINLDE